MSLNDPLANALSMVQTGEHQGRMECVVKPSSKVIQAVFGVMRDQGYVGDVSTDENSPGTVTVKLSGQVNKCGVIKPRYNVRVFDFEKFEKRYLPAKNMGIIIVSTQQGIMTHHEAKEKNIGGKLLAYCF